MSPLHRYARFALVIVVGGCAAGPPNESLGRSRAAIVGGEIDSGDPAVVEVLVKGEGECTGTLIAPSVVLTAGHCIADDPAGPFAIFTGPDDADRKGGEVVLAKSVHVHPAYDNSSETAPADVGVIVLERPLAITPVPYNKAPMTDALVGKPVRMIGYGDNTVKEPTSGFGKKRQATSPLISMTKDWVRVGTKAKNQCYGDSGGPIVMQIGGVETIVGVDSYGDNDDCDSWNDNTRVDSFLSFIDPLVIEAAATPAPSPSEGSREPEDRAAKGPTEDLAEDDASSAREGGATPAFEAACGVGRRADSRGALVPAGGLVLAGLLALLARRRRHDGHGRALVALAVAAIAACSPSTLDGDADAREPQEPTASEGAIGGRDEPGESREAGGTGPFDAGGEAPRSCTASDPFAADGLRDAVTYLASPELGGRAPGTAGDELARDFIAARFACLGLVPAGAGGSYELPFVNAGGQSTANVVGYLRGDDPVVGGDVVVVGAHHDHFGTGGGRGLRLGANDNASGIAGLLATAQALAQQKSGHRRTVVFAAFGSEETLTSAPFVEGSAAFVKAMPAGLPLSRVVYMINLDMIGTYAQEKTAYVIGSLAGTPARAILDGLRAKAGVALDLGEPGEEGDSDFYPFCIAGIPYAFFWTSDDACYHKACDTADRLSYPEMGKIVKVASELAGALADTTVDLASFRKNTSVSKLGCK